MPTIPSGNQFGTIRNPCCWVYVTSFNLYFPRLQDFSTHGAHRPWAAESFFVRPAKIENISATNIQWEFQDPKMAAR